jgi:bifunctional DNA-binding transcriptional regulator/antitoxin component of YhaV-PrlF toxin-antitoxin module
MQSKQNYIISESGLNLPIEFFTKYGLAQGDEVIVMETDQGIVVLPRVAAAMSALDEIGRALKERGVTLEDLMESGREIRGDILREKYGIDPDTDD